MNAFVGPTKIDYELPNARALIKGRFSDYPIDKEVFVEDNAGTIWRSIVETRVTGGIVVRMVDIVE